MTGMGHQITEKEYRRIRRSLRSKVRQLGVPEEDLDDLVQETFLHAQKALNQGDFGGNSSLDTWIVGIGKNRALKLFRTRRAAMRSGPETSIDAPEKATAAPALQTLEPGPEETTGNRLLLARVKRSIQGLPATLRNPLVLFASGRNYKEIAALQGISLDLVSSRIHEARTKLRKIYPRPRRSPKA